MRPSPSQLCTNYTNENLQQECNLDVFTAENKSYASEGLGFRVAFRDNADVLALIEGAGPGAPLGLLPMLDEETRVVRGSDGQ